MFIKAILWLGIFHPDHFWKTKKIFLTISFLILSFPIYATPSLQSVSPANNATGVSTVPTFVYTFNVAVTTDSKKITIYDNGDNEVGYLYADNSQGSLTGTVSGSGTNTITVAFELTGGSGNDVPLSTGSDYYVVIESDAFLNSGDKSSEIRNDFTTTNIVFSGPTLSSSSPADNATGVALASNIVLNFSENVDAETGNITIKKSSDNSTVETISVTSGQVTGSGTSQITINPSANFDRGVEYYVLVDATAFDDSDSNSYAGISSTTALSFTTSTSPALLSVSPADGATEVSMTPTFTYTFDVAVTAESKEISIYDSNDNQVGYLKADNSGGTLTGTVSGSGTNTITVAFALSGGSGNDVPLSSSTSYYVQFEADAFSGGGNTTSSIRNDFTTVTVPTLSSSSPADNATGVALASNIVLNFSENVDAETGNITIKKASDNSTVETISVTSGQVSGSGTSQITINPSANFAINTEYYVLIDATAFDDADSNSYAGISSTTALSFTSSTGPALLSVSPSDGATGVSTTPTFTYTFSSAVTANSEKIYIYNSSDQEIGYLFADGSGGGSLTGTVSGSGTDTITIAFALSGGSGNDVPLSTGSAYYIKIDSGAFSSGGNTTSEITNNFTTISAPTLSSSSPADNATNVALASNIVLNFSENVDAESGNITIKKSSDNSTVETISVTSGQVTGSGTSQITINPSSDLSSKTEYYILIDATAFDDIDSESYAGISDTTSLSFTTADVEAPTASLAYTISSSAVSTAKQDDVVRITATINEALADSPVLQISGSGVSTLSATNMTKVSTTSYYYDWTVPAGNGTQTFALATGQDTATNVITSTPTSGATITVDNTAPTITSTTVAADNSSISVTFSEAVYDTNGGSGDLEVGDFSLSISGGNATVSSTPSSISASGNVYTLGLSLSGTANGSETLSVVPSSSTAIYDAAGNPASTTQSNNTVSLNAASDTTAPEFVTTYPKNLHKNIGIDANIVLDFDMVVYTPSNSQDGNNDRYIEIWNADTGVRVFYELSDSTYVSGSGTTQITINPADDFEERVNYYILIGSNAFRTGDGSGGFFAGVSDTSTLTFMTAKDPNKYPNVTASNETGVNHALNQVEKSIAAIANRQNFIRRSGGRNISYQGINFKFNDQHLENTLNKLSPLINQFSEYGLSKQLANAVDKVLPNDWGLWTSGEISIGNTNVDNGLDRHSRSQEISVGLDKVMSEKALAGMSYRFNKTDTSIGSDGTRADSNTKTWSLYGSVKNTDGGELEGLVGWGDITTKNTRTDGANTYTGTRESDQIFACFIAREEHQIEDFKLSPFVRIDASYTRKKAYTETGDTNTAYDALHYKESKFHNTIFSVGVDTHTQFKLGDKTIKPYASFRHKENTGYEASNDMYYTSNPIKEYTHNITANSDESGFNVVLGADIESEQDWLINLSYELS